MPDTHPYELNEHPPRWWRDAIDVRPWRAREVDGVALWYDKQCECPRCGHPDGIRMSVEAEAYLGLGPNESSDVFVSCECRAIHDRRPEGEPYGCGWGDYVGGPLPGGER
jgi:hypothetical protein